MANEKEGRNYSQIAGKILELVGFLLHSLVIIISAIYKSCLPSSYQYKQNVDGRIALITGGGGGLGRLLALRLARLGATVVLWDINEKGVEETVNLVKGVGGKVYGYKCNLADRKDVYRVAKKTQEEVGDVTILINNAGVVSGHALLDTPDELIQRTFDVNIVAHFWTVKAFLPKMIEKDCGHIVTIASLAGHMGVTKLVDYCASKYAAVGFNDSLKEELFELGVEGVKTTVICPYFIQQTGMFENVSSKFFSSLKSNDVADKIVDAIRKETDLVIIPGYMRWFLPLKFLVPQAAVTLFTKTMIPDASPHHPPTPLVQIKNSEKNALHNHKINNSLSDSISQTQPSLVKGKDL